ncbi:methyltransferase domain-containing protein [Clostridium sp. C2-6-12]|uniref:MerR family transcriptional regulator n=1 Tax=Clostridium sp. C2-6-12 TaxID=2698832 RepID=UPI00136DB600|nr:methyltransferase domain-containing protein [Clostridium sp. C2-6-12]
MEKEKVFYTAGIFAKKAGITLKTIHHYHKEGLLCPSSYNEAGYRLYSDEDFQKLQKILTLKFIGFSLEEIKELIKSDYLKNNVRESLNMQMDIIDEKINHLVLVKKAINEAELMMDNESSLDWTKFTNIIKIINTEKIWLNQYKNSANLSARISLHDLFSTNKYGWHKWFYDQLDLCEDMTVLELGCGNGSLWIRNVDRIPKNCKITLTDISEGMLEDARQNLGDYSKKLNFNRVDAQNIPYEDNSFDVVIADHIFYHISDKQKALSEIKRVLKPKGYLYLATIGKNHLIELRELLKEFKSNIVIAQSDFAEDFGLENGATQISNYFDTIELLRYEDSLIVSEIEPIINYLYSTTGNSKEILVGENLKNFESFVESKMKATGDIFITKDTGVFKAHSKK